MLLALFSSSSGASLPLRVALAMKPPLTTYFNQMIISGSFLFGGPLAALHIQAAAAPLGDRNANFEDISVHATSHLMRCFSFLLFLGRNCLCCAAVVSSNHDELSLQHLLYELYTDSMVGGGNKSRENIRVSKSRDIIPYLKI